MTNETVEQSSGTGRIANGTGSEEISSSLYMHPSDNPGASLVQIPFDGT